jgi:hypothetical protein
MNDKKKLTSEEKVLKAKNLRKEMAELQLSDEEVKKVAAGVVGDNSNKHNEVVKCKAFW